MKKIVDGIIVVEGKSDVAFLSSFIDAEFVITNGSEISHDTISYLKERSKNTKIIVLTDPDYPGLKIRNKITENIENVNHAYIDKEKAIKHHKVGVAESNQKEIIKALDNLFVEKKNDYSSISYDELYELGLVGRDDSFLKRDKLSKQLHLGFNNAKNLLKKLNILGIDKSKIEEIING